MAAKEQLTAMEMIWGFMSGYMKRSSQVLSHLCLILWFRL